MKSLILGNIIALSSKIGEILTCFGLSNTESLKNIDDVPLEEITSSDSEDDIPLSILPAFMETSKDNQTETDESLLASAVENLNSSSFFNNIINDEEDENVVTVLDVPTREVAVETAKEMARS